ncbi:uncharacterized protein LOC111272509 [Varroa jacobsoni]|uniref:uncharacterized protein LOC111272509 n=1 Tax=Varroa jacobsoni TaxID=62625 RepID=UPI000BF911FC|nr:uncharacterized protein LOC111272509 [Varroa jacobsoni]XP_022709742.1 uncharacterized protein LOC111272509 [Varroa jacobsoni]
MKTHPQQYEDQHAPSKLLTLSLETCGKSSIPLDKEKALVDNQQETNGGVSTQISFPPAHVIGPTESIREPSVNYCQQIYPAVPPLHCFTQQSLYSVSGHSIPASAAAGFTTGQLMYGAQPLVYMQLPMCQTGLIPMSHQMMPTDVACTSGEPVDFCQQAHQCLQMQSATSQKAAHQTQVDQQSGNRTESVRQHPVPAGPEGGENGSSTSTNVRGLDVPAIYQTSNRQRVVVWNYCQFCQNNREPEDVYRSHTLRDLSGRVVCPVLRSYNCPICNNGGGDKAHTKSYCPQLRNRNPRNSRRHSSCGGGSSSSSSSINHQHV